MPDPTPPDAPRVEALRHAVKLKYREVSIRPDGQFGYPIGRESLLRLGYEPGWLQPIPDTVVDRFVGVGNPFRIRRPARGDAILDLGCGCGLDVFVASQLVGHAGRSVGLDMTSEMLIRARQCLADWTLGNVALAEGVIETLPFDDGAFDMVISNGVLNLVPEKQAALDEIHRVLKPGGTFAAADLLVTESLPDEVLASMDAWST